MGPPGWGQRRRQEGREALLPDLQSLLSSEVADTGDEGLGVQVFFQPTIPCDCQAPLWSTVSFRNSAPTNFSYSGSLTLFRAVFLKGGPRTGTGSIPRELRNANPRTHPVPLEAQPLVTSFLGDSFQRQRSTCLQDSHLCPNLPEGRAWCRAGRWLGC